MSYIIDKLLSFKYESPNVVSVLNFMGNEIDSKRKTEFVVLNKDAEYRALTTYYAQFEKLYHLKEINPDEYTSLLDKMISELSNELTK